jgi:hypothetical protein
MLALENCQVIVRCGSGAHFSVLSGKRHQGRTARRADEPLYRTALGGRCLFDYTALRTAQSDYFAVCGMGLDQKVPLASLFVLM